ncbi:gamma-glutamylcyclotransferase [Lentibacillus sp. CBA3610]|uniref:gamma-glutamylcyclotransferase n=1 Tax=Lentibacillus sp. CBA3610 TaxID=2518176 RepID=UPI0015960209|nr:gamma-glutamylcyclotransferase family protein [Lentibacillus sp. CBA3610]
MPYLFVYGTLRYGGKNHHLLNSARCIYHQCQVSGLLYDTGKGYPVLQENTSDWVYGELYSITEFQLREIDQLEGVAGDKPENLFRHVTAPVSNDIGERYRAFVYTGGHIPHHDSNHIPSGDWLVYKYLNQNSLLYFAYGSCMDDDRFKKAGVVDYFTNVRGRGVVGGFEFQFSRKTDDGGKADLIENNRESVEGKVYEIPLDAIDYLYEREGVHTSSYRPAIVPVTLNGSVYQSITFIGVSKSAETAPTELYGNEIVRGGNGYLSHAYLQKIRGKISRLST